MAIDRPHFVVLDSSHYASLARDWISPDEERREAARRFFPRLARQGWFPLLCLHHLEELIQHNDDALVDARLRYLISLPSLAWVRACGEFPGLGSVVDVMTAEVMAAYEYPAVDFLQVAQIAREQIISFGSPEDLFPDGFDGWQELRHVFVERQEGARRIAAISRWRSAEIDGTKISEFLSAPLRKSGRSSEILRNLRCNLEKEIADRGDRRISDPAMVAGEFFLDIAIRINSIDSSADLHPALQILINEGLALEDVDPSLVFSEAMDLLMFQKRLRLVAESAGLDWSAVKTSVKRDRIPVSFIEESMRRYSQDQAERKGSELNDLHLLCLSPYADMTFVDKRTLENVRRVQSKIPELRYFFGKVKKAANYKEISREISLY